MYRKEGKRERGVTSPHVCTHMQDPGYFIKAHEKSGHAGSYTAARVLYTHLCLQTWSSNLASSGVGNM